MAGGCNSEGYDGGNKSTMRNGLQGKQLCEQVPLFTKEWLRHNWRLLPSERVGWKDSDGVEHGCTRCSQSMRNEGAFGLIGLLE